MHMCVYIYVYVICLPQNVKAAAKEEIHSATPRGSKYPIVEVSGGFLRARRLWTFWNNKVLEDPCKGPATQQTAGTYRKKSVVAAGLSDSVLESTLRASESLSSRPKGSLPAR